MIRNKLSFDNNRQLQAFTILIEFRMCFRLLSGYSVTCCATAPSR